MRREHCWAAARAAAGWQRQTRQSGSMHETAAVCSTTGGPTATAAQQPCMATQHTRLGWQQVRTSAAPQRSPATHPCHPARHAAGVGLRPGLVAPAPGECQGRRKAGRLIGSRSGAELRCACPGASWSASCVQILLPLDFASTATSNPYCPQSQLTSEPPLQGHELVTARPAATAAAGGSGGLAGGAAPRAAWAATWIARPARLRRGRAVQGSAYPS